MLHAAKARLLTS